ncbi:MAG: 50S ribosomal protein L23 [Candidatus Omnitrophica bacterium]|nr:50S ribosomal protein L23 [Candidatus Omnitrophota bacterium]
MKTSYDIVQTLIRTEKGTTFLEPKGKYIFQVAMDSNKIEIKSAIEEIYNVKVKSVNTFIMPGKRKRVRREYGHTSDWKKAIVTLKAGQSIDVT